jgi:two-component system, sensor histidine kinase and response regulator
MEKILIVDDQPETLRILDKLLQSKNYNVLIATDGQSALGIARSQAPDLILLDVMMPGMDGFSVCRELKNHHATGDIPVLFMTALNGTEKKLEGFKIGGVDYIVKPFQLEEMLARIKTHLSLYRLQQELRVKNHDLEIKNAQLDAFAHMVAHDLKNPLNTIVGTAEITAFACEDGNIDEVKNNLQSISYTAMRAGDIIDSLLLLAQTSSASEVPIDVFDMGYVIPKVRERLNLMIKDYQAILEMPETWPLVGGNMLWIEEIWFNYISNALKYGGSPPYVRIGVEKRSNGHVCFWVRDNGPGLSEQQQRALFVPFIRLHKDRASGHGLGLSIVQNIVTRLGGEVGVESTVGQGSKFYFTLPLRSF